MKHTLFSVIRDLKNFSSVTADRNKHFTEASDTMPLPPSGVNKLAEQLHPDTQLFHIEKYTKDEYHNAVIGLQCVHGAAAPFRAGQYVNMKLPGKLIPCFLTSPSEDSEKGYYEITVPSNYREVFDAAYPQISRETEISLSAPLGYFYYSPIRDGDILCLICDASGIGAIRSIRYESKQLNICAYEYVFSDSDISEQTADEAITDILSRKPTTVFVCGTQNFCDKFTHIPGVRIRSLATDWPAGQNTKTYNCTVIIGNESTTVVCRGDEPVINALEKNGIYNFRKCLSGDCSFCRAKLISGEIEHKFPGDSDKRRLADIKFGYVHPCRAFALSDIILKY